VVAEADVHGETVLFQGEHYQAKWSNQGSRRRPCSATRPALRGAPSSTPLADPPADSGPSPFGPAA
jgi:hypothetical protein